MRLFVAIDLPAPVRTAIGELIARIRRPGPKWVDARNLHLTLKFIGEIPNAESIMQALANVSGPPVEIRLKDLGSFPRVLWVGVQAPPELTQLARGVEQALIPLGIPAERRAFSPHLTIARIKDGRMPSFDEHPDFGSFQVSDFALYQSKLAPAGATYTALRRYPLTTP
jgi:2'-5' RNA ligase